VAVHAIRRSASDQSRLLLTFETLIGAELDVLSNVDEVYTQPRR